MARQHPAISNIDTAIAELTDIRRRLRSAITRASATVNAGYAGGSSGGPVGGGTVSNPTLRAALTGSHVKDRVLRAELATAALRPVIGQTWAALAALEQVWSDDTSRIAELGRCVNDHDPSCTALAERRGMCWVHYRRWLTEHGRADTDG